MKPICFAVLVTLTASGLTMAVTCLAAQKNAEDPLSERCESAPAGSVARRTPEWFARGVIYQIQPRAFTAEGTLKAATARIPWLRDLGVTVIYLNPVFVMDDDMDRSKWSGRQKASGFDSPCNLYRIKDYDHVDPEFGTDADLREFVEVAHRNGLKVLLDLVYLHCGPGARLVKEHPEFFKRHPDGTIAPSQWHFPLFDFTNPATRRHLIASGLGWVTGYGVDGFRCDVADETPADFWAEFRAAADKVKPDLVLIAEGVRPSNTIYTFDCNYHWPLCRSVLTSALPDGFRSPKCDHEMYVDLKKGENVFACRFGAGSRGAWLQCRLRPIFAAE